MSIDPGHSPWRHEEAAGLNKPNMAFLAWYSTAVSLRGTPATAAKMRNAPERSQECSDKKMRLVRAPVPNRTAMAADEAGALTVMENISAHSTQNTAAATQSRRTRTPVSSCMLDAPAACRKWMC